jgi:hypothetical protein
MCASRASRAREERLKPGPSHSPTASEIPSQATRPIGTHHHALMSAFTQRARHITYWMLTVRLRSIARRHYRPVKAERPAHGHPCPRLVPRPVPDRAAARRGRAMHRQMPRRPAASSGRHRRRAVT